MGGAAPSPFDPSGGAGGGIGAGGAGSGGGSIDTYSGAAGANGNGGRGQASFFGAGGAGGMLGATSSGVQINSPVAGGTGSGGGTAAGGGGGGTGVSVASGTSFLTVNGTVTGGMGGAGGGWTVGGAGGGGGAGVVFSDFGTLQVIQTITGGAGGNGGSGTQGSAGGGGGAAVVMLNGGTIASTYNIIGGKGGDGGGGVVNGNGGSGGSAIIGANLSISNSGTIQGGARGTGGSATDGAAIQFVGGVNTLDLYNASVTRGAIWVGSNSTATIRANANGLSLDSLILDGATTLTTNAGNRLTVTGTISGSQSLIANGAGTIVVAGNNTSTGGTRINFGTLEVVNGGALGTGAVTNNASLVFNRSDVATVTNTISGTGNLTQAGTGTTVLTGNNDYSGVTIINAGTLQVGNGGTSGSLGTGIVSSIGSLAFNRSDIATVANTIMGGGGITQAGTGTTVLTGNNSYFGSTVINAGTLQVGNGGTTGSLGLSPVLNMGTLSFNRADNIFVSNGISGAGAVVQDGTGTLTLAGANFYAGGATLNRGTLIASSSSALGSGTFTINGGTFGTSGFVTNPITVNGSFGLRSGFQLNGPITLTTTPTISLTAAGSVQLNGAISGAHGLTIDSTLPAGQWSDVVMSGSASNTYTGLTTVQGSAALGLNKQGNATAVAGDLLVQGNAIVALGAGEQIANSATVTVNSAGHANSSFTYEGLALLGFQLGGARQVETIGTLRGNGTIGLGNSKLVVGQGEFSGVISDGALATSQGRGAGQLEKTGAGTLTLSGANTYTGGTVLKGGTLAVGHSRALGTGGLSMDDNTTLAFAADNLTIANPIVMTGTNDPTFDTGANTATLTGGISGAADVTKAGTGTLILGAANNTYTGSTTVAQGTLRAGAANAFSAGSATTIASGATLDLAGYNQTLASVNNAGTVSLVGSTPGTILTVTGPWVGQGGVLALGATLAGNASVTDKLILSGASAVASGNTLVRITNLSGLGAQTSGNGIEIISAVNGGSIGAGAFSLATPVAAGAYDYQLKLTSTGSYLSSTASDPVAPGTTSYRAEVPLYAALSGQLRESNLAMVGNMHQRVGDDGVTGANTGTFQHGKRQAWGRVISIDRDIAQSGTVSPSSSGRLTGFQAGTDLWANASWRAGVYVGQLEGDMSVTGFARGLLGYGAGSNDLRSQYLGTYATWEHDTGLYLDGVLQAGRHRYTVGPSLAASSGGKGDSLLASVEVGQALRVAPNWVVEPQVQLVHQRVDLNDTGIVGALVQQDSASGWTVRAGVRVKGEFQTGAGTVQPYARVNVYKRGRGTDVTRFAGPAGLSDIATRMGGTSSELAVGATWQMSASTGLYGEVGKLWAAGGDVRTKSGVNGSLGVKVRW